MQQRVKQKPVMYFQVLTLGKRSDVIYIDTGGKQVTRTGTITQTEAQDAALNTRKPGCDKTPHGTITPPYLRQFKSIQLM